MTVKVHYVRSHMYPRWWRNPFRYRRMRKRAREYQARLDSDQFLRAIHEAEERAFLFGEPRDPGKPSGPTGATGKN